MKKSTSVVKNFQLAFSSLFETHDSDVLNKTVKTITFKKIDPIFLFASDFYFNTSYPILPNVELPINN